MKMKNFRRIAIPLCIVLWTAFIWSQSLQSAEDSSADSSRVAQFLMRLFGWDTQPEWLIYAIRKTAHFAEFALLGMLWGACGRRRLWLCGLPTGVIDECLQFLAPGRAPMIIDVLIDTVGYLCGGVFVLLVRRWINGKKKEEME